MMLSKFLSNNRCTFYNSYSPPQDVLNNIIFDIFRIKSDGNIVCWISEICANNKDSSKNPLRKLRIIYVELLPDKAFH